jgi:hypothetical protein
MKKDPPERAELLKLVMGPSGNLRAPAIRAGKTLLVGFSDEAYTEVFVNEMNVFVPSRR